MRLETSFTTLFEHYLNLLRHEARQIEYPPLCFYILYEHFSHGTQSNNFQTDNFLKLLLLQGFFNKTNKDVVSIRFLILRILPVQFYIHKS